MNNRTLEDTCKDIESFYHIIIKMKQDLPLLYDLTLKFPAWRGELSQDKTTHSKNHPEDYGNALLADLAKFRAHAEMLQQPSALITAEEINKSNIVTVSQRIMEYLQTYTSHTRNVPDKILCQRLKDDMENIHVILENISGFRPQRPMKP